MIVGMMRIKNEARWIERVLRSMLPACERIFVFDDHSTDETVTICQSIPEVVLFHSPFDGLDETRDKNWLLARVATEIRPGDWIVSIDGDEEIAEGGAQEICRLAALPSGPDAYRFQVLYLWDRADQIRVDGIYKRFSRSSMFRYHPGAQFRSSCGGGFHCGNVPQPRDLGMSTIRLLHYGYMVKEDRIRKWHFYNESDPVNEAEGYSPDFPERRTYPHIVQGDVPEVPAHIKLRHAGPLELRPL